MLIHINTKTTSLISTDEPSLDTKRIFTVLGFSYNKELNRVYFYKKFNSVTIYVGCDYYGRYFYIWNTTNNGEKINELIKIDNVADIIDYIAMIVRIKPNEACIGE